MGEGRRWDTAEKCLLYNSEEITRTSVLLCRRGGLIVPLTSGQKIKKYGTGTIYALACATSGGNPGELEWEQMKAK